MFARLALIFVIVPLLELALLIQVGQVVGLGPTILLVLATGVGGAALARREGLRTLSAIQRDMASGRIPGSALLDGAAILFGGALLLTPGILTDVFGLSLLVPATRRWFARRMRRWFQRQLDSGTVQWVVGTPDWVSRSGETPGNTHDFPQDPARRGLDPEHEIDGEGS